MDNDVAASEMLTDNDNLEEVSPNNSESGVDDEIVMNLKTRALIPQLRPMIFQIVYLTT